MLFYIQTMGLDDRDYMKDADDDVVNLGALVVTAAKVVVILIACFFWIRFPVLWVKIPVIAAILFLGWRWIFRSKKKRVPMSRPGKPVLERSQPALESVSTRDPIRMLIALDAAGEFGKAKTLIQQMDGEELSREDGEELAILARNYFPIELVPTEHGVRFRLA